jgi:hypothetical protein
MLTRLMDKVSFVIEETLIGQLFSPLERIRLMLRKRVLLLLPVN